MTVQEKLKKLRKEKHFSDKDVAEILGMRLNAYSMLEHGVVKLGSFLKNKLGLLYDKDPDYFVDDPEVEPEPEPEPEPELEEEIMVEAEIEPEADIETEIVPGPEIESENIAEVDLEPENVGEVDLESEITAEPETEISEEIMPKPEIEPEPEIETEPMAEPDIDPENIAEVEVEPEPEISEEIMPEVEIEPEPMVEPVTEPEPVKETPGAEPNHFVPESKKVEVGTIEFQYAGKAVSLSDIIDRTKEACGDEAVDLNIYIKPEENRVYFVSGNHTGSFEM